MRIAAAPALLYASQQTNLRFVSSAQADSQLSQGARLGRYSSAERKKGEEGPLAKICRDTTKLSAEQIKGLSSQVIKSILFNCNPRLAPPQQQQQRSTGRVQEPLARSLWRCRPEQLQHVCCGRCVLPCALRCRA